MDENTQLENVLVSPVHSEEPLQQAGPAWQSMLDNSLCDHALEVVHLIAERMREPARVVAIAEVARTQTKSMFHWAAPSFSCGFGGLVLPYLYLSRRFPGQGWENLSRLYMRLAAEGTHQTPLVQLGIFGGSSGLATVVTLLSRDDARYRKTCNTLNTNVATQVLEWSWRREKPGVADADYDVIGGATGILRYLIATGAQEAIVQDAIQKLLEYLVWLGCGEDEQGRKHWFIPPELFPLERFREHYPDGYFNIGLAHGIPGPLAVLSLAWQAGYRIDGQREAIEGISHWIVEHRIQDQWGINWPSGVPLQASYSAEEWSKLHPTRAAWCYGAPGVARSLWLAGTALEDRMLCQTAVESIEAVLRRPLGERNIDSPTLCHGMGGLLIMCLRFVREGASPTIRHHIPLLVHQMLEACSPEYPLGVRDEEHKGNFVDDPGFLTGAAGVVLALLAAATSIEPDWDCTLLLT